MREIKFRAWDTKRKEWKSRLNVHVNGIGEKIWQLGDSFDVYPEVKINLSTGLKDKNGKEIYEGDYVQAKATPYWTDFKSEYMTGEIFWSDDYLGWAIKNDGTTRRPIDKFGELEVFGNIYETPNLLEQPHE